MSWDYFDKDIKTREDVTPSKEDLIIFNAFSTEDGQRALEVLKKVTLEKPVFQSIGSDSGNTLLLAGVREGENNLIRKIEDAIRRVRKK